MHNWSKSSVCIKRAIPSILAPNPLPYPLYKSVEHSFAFVETFNRTPIYFNASVSAPDPRNSITPILSVAAEQAESTPPATFLYGIAYTNHSEAHVNPVYLQLSADITLLPGIHIYPSIRRYIYYIAHGLVASSIDEEEDCFTGAPWGQLKFITRWVQYIFIFYLARRMALLTAHGIQ